MAVSDDLRERVVEAASSRSLAGDGCGSLDAGLSLPRVTCQTCEKQANGQKRQTPARPLGVGSRFLLDVSQEIGNSGGFLICRGHQPVPLAEINPTNRQPARRCWTPRQNSCSSCSGSSVAARRHGRLLAVVPPVATVRDFSEVDDVMHAFHHVPIPSRQPSFQPTSRRHQGLARPAASASSRSARAAKAEIALCASSRCMGQLGKAPGVAGVGGGDLGLQALQPAWPQGRRSGLPASR